MEASHAVMKIVSENAKRLAEAETQTGLAEKAGFSQKTASNLMHGRNIQCDKIGGLAQALRVPAFSLFIPGLFSASDARQMGKLLHLYLGCGSEGRSQILRTAEVEQRHALMHSGGQD